MDVGVVGIFVRERGIFGASVVVLFLDGETLGVSGALHDGCAGGIFWGRGLGSDAKDSQAEGVDGVIVRNGIEAETAENGLRGLKFGDAQQEDAIVIEEDAAELRIGRNVESFGAFEMLESLRVIAEFEFAEAEHGIGGAIAGSEGKELAKGGGRGAIVIAIVFEGAEGPPAFGPFGA